MATEVYLAMSSEEFDILECPPVRLGWIDCCFSQTTPGLDHLPSTLPENDLLILTDRIPFQNHDPIRITEELHQTVTALNCAGMLLDFEKPKQKELAHLAQMLAASLPCPVAVSELYAGDMDCPVFLSPCPHHVPLSEHIAPWKGKDIWLDLARDAESITVTPDGAVVSSTPWLDSPPKEYADKNLHCHYHIEIADNAVRFILRRTKEDLEALLQESQKLGIQNCIGLYQEWT